MLRLHDPLHPLALRPRRGELANELQRLGQLGADGEVVDPVANLSAGDGRRRRGDAHDGVRAIDPIAEVAEGPSWPERLYPGRELMEHDRHGDEPLSGRDAALV